MVLSVCKVSAKKESSPESFGSREYVGEYSNEGSLISSAHHGMSLKLVSRPGNMLYRVCDGMRRWSHPIERLVEQHRRCPRQSFLQKMSRSSNEVPRTFRSLLLRSRNRQGSTMFGLRHKFKCAKVPRENCSYQFYDAALSHIKDEIPID